MTGCFPTPACELPGGPYTLLVGWAGWLLAALAVLGAGFALQLILDGVFRLLVLIPAVRRRLLAPAGLPPVPTFVPGGRNVLTAKVRGADIPALEAAAMERAREFFGPYADLSLGDMRDIFTSCVGRQDFLATVTVRYLGQLHDSSGYARHTPPEPTPGTDAGQSHRTAQGESVPGVPTPEVAK